jgi:hypothetical protein
VLRVPSAVIPAEYNFLLNLSHKDFEKLRIGKPQRFRFDRRLTDKPLILPHCPRSGSKDFEMVPAQEYKSRAGAELR